MAMIWVEDQPVSSQTARRILWLSAGGIVLGLPLDCVPKQIVTISCFILKFLQPGYDAPVQSVNIYLIYTL